MSDIHDGQRDHGDAAHREGEGGEYVVRFEVFLRERSDMCTKSRNDDAAEDGEALCPGGSAKKTRDGMQDRGINSPNETRRYSCNQFAIMEARDRFSQPMNVCGSRRLN